MIYLLDTNHCSRVLENDPTVLERLAALGDATIATCTIVQGDNDLWVAAAAKRHGCIIVSNDRDFARIAEVTDLVVETWWTPLDQP